MAWKSNGKISGLPAQLSEWETENERDLDECLIKLTSSREKHQQSSSRMRTACFFYEYRLVVFLLTDFSIMEAYYTQPNFLSFSSQNSYPNWLSNRFWRGKERKNWNGWLMAIRRKIWRDEHDSFVSCREQRSASYRTMQKSAVIHLHQPLDFFYAWLKCFHY